MCVYVCMYIYIYIYIYIHVYKHIHDLHPGVVAHVAELVGAEEAIA